MDLCGNQDKGRERRARRRERITSPKEHTGADMNKGFTVTGMVDLFVCFLFLIFDSNLICKKFRSSFRTAETGNGVKSV